MHFLTKQRITFRNTIERNNMFELADKMVGIYKTHDVTQTITVCPNQIANRLQQALKPNPEEVVRDSQKEQE